MPTKPKTATPPKVAPKTKPAPKKTAAPKAKRAPAKTTKAKTPPPAKAKAAPTPTPTKTAPRSRVNVTIEMLERPEGCTVDELVAAFANEFDGNGKRSTAAQAMHKIPKAKGFQTVRTAEEGRGSVYRKV